MGGLSKSRHPSAFQAGVCSPACRAMCAMWCFRNERRWNGTGRGRQWEECVVGEAPRQANQAPWSSKRNTARVARDNVTAGEECFGDENQRMSAFRWDAQVMQVPAARCRRKLELKTR